MKKWTQASLLLVLWLVLLAFLAFISSVAAPSLAQGDDTPVPTATAASDNTLAGEPPLAGEPVMVTVDMPAVADGDGVLRISGLEIQKTEYSLDKVLLSVRNVSSDMVNGWGWYFLSAPDEPEPWNHYNYVSPEQPVVALESGATAILEFSGPDAEALLMGEYRLSLWLHYEDAAGGERVHADGFSYDTPLVIGPGPLFIVVDEARVVPSQTETEGAMAVNVRFFIYNMQPNEGEIGISYSVALPDDLTPWATGVFNMPFKYFTVRAMQKYTISYQHTMVLPQGTPLQVTGWLHEVVDGVSQHHASNIYSELIEY